MNNTLNTYWAIPRMLISYNDINQQEKKNISLLGLFNTKSLMYICP